jgi:hypothetical protein
MGGPPLSPETEKRVELLFPPEDWERVSAMLVDECGENIPGWKMADIERLRFAALKLSQGKIHKLAGAVDLAKIYFRDVLMAAGFGETDSYKSWLPERTW